MFTMGGQEILLIPFSIAAGSLFGTWIGGMLLGIVSESVLIPMLVLLLVLSAIKVWKHK